MVEVDDRRVEINLEKQRKGEEGVAETRSRSHAQSLEDNSGMYVGTTGPTYFTKKSTVNTLTSNLTTVTFLTPTPFQILCLF